MKLEPSTDTEIGSICMAELNALQSPVAISVYFLGLISPP